MRLAVRVDAIWDDPEALPCAKCSFERSACDVDLDMAHKRGALAARAKRGRRDSPNNWSVRHRNVHAHLWQHRGVRFRLAVGHGHARECNKQIARTKSPVSGIRASDVASSR